MQVRTFANVIYLVYMEIHQRWMWDFQVKPGTWVKIEGAVYTAPAVVSRWKVFALHWCIAAIGQISVYEKLYAIVARAFIGEYLGALHGFLFTARATIYTSSTGAAWWYLPV